MKRVLFLIKGLGTGGAEQLLVSTTRHLDRSRFQSEVARLLADKDALASELAAQRVPSHALGGGAPGSWPWRLRRLVRDREVDLVHAHSPYAAVGARAALPRALPLVYTEHNVWESYRRPTCWGNLLSFPRNDHVFTVSDRVRASLRYPGPLRRRPMPPVETLYHGYDPAALGEPAEPGSVRAALGIPAEVPVVGTVASFKPQKGHRHLLDAATRVREAVPEVRFVLVGSGPLEGAIRRQADELGLGETLVLTGHREDTGALIRSFDVFALSSLHEGLSIALLEAMALGKPVVVTEAGGLPEAVDDGEDGLVVRAGDPSALAAGILSLLGDPALRRRLGEGARDRAAGFDIRRAVRRMEEVYGSLTA